ncbi:MAG: glucose-6-phosphate isomerase, partial [Rhodobacter sp.]|nr:glucose-6-phosphate isomerase [Rhodobacter sp.]
MTSQWKRLTDKAAAVQGRRILDLFDGGRAAEFSARLDDMLLDYSKTNIDHETLDLLLEIATAADVATRR